MGVAAFVCGNAHLALADIGEPFRSLQTGLPLGAHRPHPWWWCARGGLGAFLYLEVLDASFSFDGVIGAFALTNNILLIAIGLGVGAMYVRSMTIMLVERGTLAQFRYLEHGAFYSIFALSIVMFLQSLMLAAVWDRRWQYIWQSEAMTWPCTTRLPVQAPKPRQAR